VSREDAAYQLWRLLLSSAAAREALSKVQHVEVLLRTVEIGRPEEQHTCAGALAVMARDEQFSNVALLSRKATLARIVKAARRVLGHSWPHPRSKACFMSPLQTSLMP
jgi:hypothetical protein